MVLTATKRRIAVTMSHNDDLGGPAYYPLRPGYASSILKFQGAELPHVGEEHVPPWVRDG